MNKNFSIQPYVQKIDKPWGFELILTPSDSPVTGKILHINAQSRFSLQYHEIKQEALVLIKGEANIILEDKSGLFQQIKMKLNKGYFIKPKQKHRCQAITDCDIMEVSTSEKGATVRLEDDYARKDETEEERLKQRKYNF